VTPLEANSALYLDDSQLGDPVSGDVKAFALFD
jgi:hypothetical protein